MSAMPDPIGAVHPEFLKHVDAWQNDRSSPRCKPLVMPFPLGWPMRPKPVILMSV
jgi:hypothetical protein